MFISLMKQCVANAIKFDKSEKELAKDKEKHDKYLIEKNKILQENLYILRQSLKGE